MAQYDILSKCRVPAETVDIPRQTEVERSKHVIIIRNGHVSSCLVMVQRLYQFSWSELVTKYNSVVCMGYQHAVKLNYMYS